MSKYSKIIIYLLDLFISFSSWAQIFHKISFLILMKPIYLFLSKLLLWKIPFLISFYAIIFIWLNPVYCKKDCGIYIYYCNKEYLERKLKNMVKILEKQFFILKNIHSAEKDIFKHWDLQYTKLIILFISFFSKSITHYEFIENRRFNKILLGTVA